MGLKPVFKPACPRCDFTLKYYVCDPQVHPDNWVLTAESREHLNTAHIARPQLHIVRDEPELLAA